MITNLKDCSNVRIMNKKTRYILVLFAIIGIFSETFADIAPTQYKGWTLSPRFESRVRMTKEVVDIYWGEVCEVKAIFNLVNDSDSIIPLKIGFPVNLTFLKTGRRMQKDSINRIYDFKFLLNDTELKETDIPDSEINSRKEQWYGWDCKIQPGKNSIYLTYNVKTSPTYAYGWKRNLFYVLHTGKFWNRKIDSAVVTVHFPQKIVEDQIQSSTMPSGFTVYDSSITWEFKSFEPTDEHNIHLEIISFDTYQKIQIYKTELSKKHVDTGTKLDAAIFYSSLTFAKGINFTAPSSIDSAYYYTSVLPNLSSDERKIFQQEYGKTKYNAVGLLKLDKSYNEFVSDEKIQHILKSALLRTGYYGSVEYKECWKFVELARHLFNEAVTEEPKNANAWLAYLENAYRIHPEGCNPCKFGFSLRTGGYFQNEIAIEAYKHCPNNAKIKLWHDFAVPHSAELPDTVGKVRGQSEEGVELLIRDQSSGGGIIQSISTNDFNAIEKKYQIVDNNFLVKTNRKIDEETKNVIVDILYRNTFYHLRLCRELKALIGKKN